MDLQQEWNKLQETNLAPPPPLPAADILAALQQRSNAPLAKVERIILIRLYAVLGYLVLASGFMAYSWAYPEKRGIAWVILGYYFFALVFSAWQLWYLRQKAVLMGGDLLHTLQGYYALVKLNLRIDSIANWLVYPMSFALGFFYAVIDPGESVWDIIINPRLSIPLSLGMLVITPLLWWLNQRINQKVFGNLLVQLEENIADLNEKEL
jgi:hypothetical protein